METPKKEKKDHEKKEKKDHRSLEVLFDNEKLNHVTGNDCYVLTNAISLQHVRKGTERMRGVVAKKTIPKGSFWLEWRKYSVLHYAANYCKNQVDYLIEQMMQPYEWTDHLEFLTMFGYKDVKLPRVMNPKTLTLMDNVVVSITDTGTPILSMLNHHIDGNVDYYWYEHDHHDGKKTEWFRFCCTNRVIQKGEELTVSYFSLQDSSEEISKKYYMERGLEVEPVMTIRMEAWDSMRDQVVTKMKENLLFSQIKQDLVNLIVGKPCVLSRNDIAETHELSSPDSMPPPFVGKFVLHLIGNGHYTLEKVEHLLQIKFHSLFPYCATYVEDRLTSMRDIFLVLQSYSKKNNKKT